MRRYHPLLAALHWLLAVMIITGLFMGNFVLAETPNDDPAKLFSLRMHMSAGLAILVLMAVRLGARLFTAKPPEADIGNATLNLVGRLTHWVFYILVFALCASGIAMSQMAGLPDIVFGGSGAPLPESFYDYPPRRVHGLLATLLALLVLGHVAAALYHQVIRKDGLIGRMWFGARNS